MVAGLGCPSRAALEKLPSFLCVNRHSSHAAEHPLVRRREHLIPLAQASDVQATYMRPGAAVKFLQASTALS
jgi:hypothetical protein